jgi:hypothetical protein
LKALTNLVLPLLQANAALSALPLPSLVMRAGNAVAFRELLRSALLLFFAGAALYGLFLGTLGRPLVHLLYDGKYDGAASLLWLLALLPLLDGVAVVFASGLRSLEHPKLVLGQSLRRRVRVDDGNVGDRQMGARRSRKRHGPGRPAGSLTAQRLCLSVRASLASRGREARR